MPNVDDFTITANASILNALCQCIPCCPDTDVKLDGNTLSFSVYHHLDMKTVRHIRVISRRYPDETIYVSFSAELYFWMKEEKYQVKNGIFFFSGTVWHGAINHDYSDNRPDLLIVAPHRNHNHLLPDLAAYPLP